MNNEEGPCVINDKKLKLKNLDLTHTHIHKYILYNYAIILRL
jgi:hypothetical protein